MQKAKGKIPVVPRPTFQTAPQQIAQANPEGVQGQAVHDQQQQLQQQQLLLQQQQQFQNSSNQTFNNQNAQNFQAQGGNANLYQQPPFQNNVIPPQYPQTQFSQPQQIIQNIPNQNINNGINNQNIIPQSNNAFQPNPITNNMVNNNNSNNLNNAFNQAPQSYSQQFSLVQPKLPQAQLSQYPQQLSQPQQQFSQNPSSAQVPSQQPPQQQQNYQQNSGQGGYANLNQQNSSSNIDEQRIYNDNVAFAQIPKLQNTELEQNELQIATKNKIESSSYFKTHIESQNQSSQDYQPCIFDMKKSIEKTKLFCQQNQNLALKLKESMENLFKYDPNNLNPNKIDISFNKFIEDNQINFTGIINYSPIVQELNKFAARPYLIDIPLIMQLLTQELSFLKSLSEVDQKISEINKNQTLKIKLSSLSLYSQFIYLYLIKGDAFEITIDFQDYHLFETTGSDGGIQMKHFVALLFYALKSEQRFDFLLKNQSKAADNENTFLDLSVISRYFSQHPLNPTIKLIIKTGQIPSINQQPIDKYRDLFNLYEKGCKSSVFKFIYEGKWPDNQFQKQFEDQYKYLGQFQLWLIWMRQMQEKIIDFQLFMFSRVKQGFIDQVNKEFSQRITNKIKQLSTDIQNCMFMNLDENLYCVATSIQSKDRKTSVNSIIYDINEQSSILVGNVICQRTDKSLCFYFKDKQDQSSIKKISVLITNQNDVSMLRSSQPLRVDSDFRINSIVHSTYSFILLDNKQSNERYLICDKYYDTILINRLIEQSRKEKSTQSPITLNLDDLLLRLR